MTTEPTSYSTNNVFIENDVLCLRQTPFLDQLSLGATAWIPKGETPPMGHERGLEKAAISVLSTLPDHSLWLLAGHTSWQPDSRMTRYRKLWSSLRMRGLEMPQVMDARESLIEAEEGVRFFGAVQVEVDSLKWVLPILEAEPVSHLVVLGPEPMEVIDGLLRSGWDRPAFGPSEKILKAVCSSKGGVFWLVGAFDDPESGAVVLALPEIIKGIVS